MDTLPMETAARLCCEIQDAQWIKVVTQCWGCTTFSKGDPAQMCGGVVACNLVLKRYKKMESRAGQPT